MLVCKCEDAAKPGIIVQSDWKACAPLKLLPFSYPVLKAYELKL